MKTFYQCDPELFRRCKKTLCQKECTLTSFEKYAKRDEFGRPIVACIDNLFEPAEEPEGVTHEYGRPTGKNKELDGCENCRFEDKEGYEEPCWSCSHNHTDNWRAKE